LASGCVTHAMKQAIGEWVPDLIKASITSLIEENSSIPTEEFSAWGLPSVEAARAHAEKAIREIVIPGLEHLGISTDAVS